MLIADIVNFLKRDPQVARLNFAYKTYKIWPAGYQVDVVDAINSGDIKVKFDSGAVSTGAGATYFVDFDTLELPTGFSLTSTTEKALIVHECTHALIDLQKIGVHPAHETEAVGYLAEAMFLVASKTGPISAHAMRATSHAIATTLLSSGGYLVSAADWTTLVTAIAADPLYKGKTDSISNRFDRPFWKNAIR